MLKRLQKRGENCLHTFFDKSRSFSKLWILKSLKNKLCLFYKSPAWWKTTQTSHLTKVGGFQSVETSNFNNLKKTNFVHFRSCLFGEKLTKPIFWQMWKLLKVLKFQKLANPNFADIVTFLLWWKTNERYLLTKLRTFHCFETPKDWKGKLCSFYKLSVLWKTTQRLLLTKVAVSTNGQITK